MKLTQPKPTGKWTQEWLRQYLAGYSSYDLQLKAIADAHNAALAAERGNRQHAERLYAAHIEGFDRDELIQQLREQLAAEREKLEAVCKVSQDSQRALWEAMKQLATAQAANAYNERFMLPNSNSIKLTNTTALDAAIAAAQQPLVNGLTLCLSAIRHEPGSSEMRACVEGDRVLAKAKEGK